MYAKGDSPLYDRGVVVTYLVAIEVPRVQFPAVVLPLLFFPHHLAPREITCVELSNFTFYPHTHTATLYGIVCDNRGPAGDLRAITALVNVKGGGLITCA